MITIIISVVLLFFLLLCPSMTVNAQAMPSISTPTFEVIDGGMESLLNGYGANYGIWGIENQFINEAVQSILGIDPKLQPSDFHVRPLTDIEKENLETGFTTHFYDSEGVEIPISDLYYVSGDNGYFHSEFYVDVNGNVLFSDPNRSHTLVNVGLTETSFNRPEGEFNSWGDLMSQVSSEIKENNFNFVPDGSDITNYSYLNWIGSTSGGRPSSAAYILIPNQYNPGDIVPVNTSNTSYVRSWYTNSLDNFTFKQTYGSSNWLRVEEASYSKDGRDYQYLITFADGINSSSLNINQTFEEWLENTPSGISVFGKEGLNYNQSYSVNSRRFINVNPDEVPQILPDEYYSYDELQQLQPETDPLENPNFDPYSPLDPDNWPQSFPMPSGVIDPSSLPLPGSNPGINPIPGIGDNPIVDINPDSPLPFDVPILNNLQYRFPFSIPWDLWRMFRRTVFQPVAPAWDFDWSITVLGHTYTTHFQGDLSAFDSLAEIFRTLLLVSFVLFLAFVSYKFFF